ncbi:MAG: hypothetical protein K0S07_599 [Chlamydiales bacterium]|jgi:hypothetical protein|nr:hypothetical protein [Chlamydiales bacterium]
MRRINYSEVERQLNLEMEKKQIERLQEIADRLPRRPSLFQPEPNQEKTQQKAKFLSQHLLQTVRWLHRTDPEIALKIDCSRKELKEIAEAPLEAITKEHVEKLQKVQQAVSRLRAGMRHAALAKSSLEKSHPSPLPNARPWLSLASYPPKLLPPKKVR